MMPEKPKHKPTDEFVVPYSLQESIYRILETKNIGDPHFVPLVEKLTSETYEFRLRCLRIQTSYQKFTSQDQLPVVEIEGQLQALDDNSTLVTAHLHRRWLVVLIGIGLPYILLAGFAPFMPIVVVLGVACAMAGVWVVVLRQLQADAARLKSLLYEAMSE